MWVVVPPEALESLDAINAQHEDRRIEPITDADGHLVVSDEPLGDAYWADWHEWLRGVIAGS
jgi:hypothetical protein